MDVLEIPWILLITNGCRFSLRRSRVQLNFDYLLPLFSFSNTLYVRPKSARALVDPPHGYGSNMNICIDCRIDMFKKAKEFADEIGADYFVTGEVVGQRPFSQRRAAMKLIEKESGLEGKILRPLSAKLLEETDMEKDGIVDREALLGIQGRTRKPQIALAEELSVYDYPCPSGGCLLTDAQFSKKLRDYLDHEGTPNIPDMFLLRLGQHFRIKGIKVVIGRDEKENRILTGLAARNGWAVLTV